MRSLNEYYKKVKKYKSSVNVLLSDNWMKAAQLSDLEESVKVWKWQKRDSMHFF